MHRADIGRGLDPAGHTQTEIGAVDGDEHIRSGLDHGGGGFLDPALEVEIFRQHLGQTHDAEFFHRKSAGQAPGLHLGPADAVEGDAGHEGFQPGHQRPAKPVARRLARQNEGAHQPARSRTQRKSPRSRAAATVASRSSTMTPPASMTIPSSPAAAAPSIVRGPMVGRSMRRSCPCLGAL
jgi:hypothetical protein